MADPSFLPVFQGKFPRVRGFWEIPGFFGEGRGVRAIMASVGKNARQLQAGRSMGGGGDIKARVGPRCKVKLPQPGAGRRIAGWRHLGCFIHQHPSGGEGGGRGQGRAVWPRTRLSERVHVCVRVRGRRASHPPELHPPEGLAARHRDARKESDSFLRIPGASPALPWLLYDVASLISGSPVQDRGGERLEVIMFLSWGEALSNPASPCIRCRKMALKSTSACFLQADRIYCAVTPLRESRRIPTESGWLYPDPGSARHVLAEPLERWDAPVVTGRTC